MQQCNSVTALDISTLSLMRLGQTNGVVLSAHILLMVMAMYIRPQEGRHQEGTQNKEMHMLEISFCVIFLWSVSSKTGL